MRSTRTFAIAPNTTPAGPLHGLHRLVADLADEAPLLLVVDDAHRADEPPGSSSLTSRGGCTPFPSRS